MADEPTDDPDVRNAAKALILKSLHHAEHQLDHGDPASKREIIKMFAGGAIKEAVSGGKGTKADQAAEVEALRDDFHALRRRMTEE